MRDFAIGCLLAACISATFYRPWLGVLALACFGYMQPHKFAWDFMGGFPVYLVLFGVAVAAALTTRDRQLPPRDWRLAAFALLWLYFLLTTWFAMLPWAAWPKFIEVTKILVPLALTLVLINTREKLFCLLVTIAICIALVTLKGGYWAVMTGFKDRVYGPPGSAFYDNNQFAVLVIMNLPLLVLWLRETRDWLLRQVLMGAVALSVAAALSSWSRGALLTLGATLPFLLWHSQRKWLAALLLGAGVVLALLNLSEGWFARMETIASYQEDASAQARLRAWKTGIDYALHRPVLGTGFNSYIFLNMRGHNFGMDWHSAYVEIMAEHGLIAFAIWCALLFGTMLSLTRLARVGRCAPELAWIVNYSLMLRASLIAYAVGALFLGISYWDIWYHLVISAILLKKFALEEVALYSDRTILAGADVDPLEVVAVSSGSKV